MIKTLQSALQDLTASHKTGPKTTSDIFRNAHKNNDINLSSDFQNINALNHYNDMFTPTPKKEFRPDALEWSPASPFPISCPTENNSSKHTIDDMIFDEELKEALEEIQFLKEELEMSKLINSHDEFFYPEKIKDLEFELSELSDNFGDFSFLLNKSEEWEKSRILETRTQKKISNGDTVICQVTGEEGIVKRIYIHRAGVKFQSGYRTCEIALLEKTKAVSYSLLVER